MPRASAAPVPAGYSGTPLAKKLGIAEGCRLHARGTPDNYRELLAPLPGGVQFVRRLDAATDIAHLFSTRRSELAGWLRAARATMRPDAALWVSWPKRAAAVATDITEDVVRELALPLGLVDIKVCAVDDTWSGLKLMVRREQRTVPAAKRSAAQRSARAPRAARRS